MLPDPVILFPFKSNEPPNCGDVSSDTSVISSMLLVTIQPAPPYFKTEPATAPVVSTSVSSLNSLAVAT